MPTRAASASSCARTASRSADDPRRRRRHRRASGRDSRRAASAACASVRCRSVDGSSCGGGPTAPARRCGSCCHQRHDRQGDRSDPAGRRPRGGPPRAAPDARGRARPRGRRGGQRRRGGRQRCALHDDIDLAILDVSMPRLTGIQVARQLAEHRPGPARADPLDARQRAVLLRGAARGGVGLRAEVRGARGPRRRVPRGACAASRSSTRAAWPRSSASYLDARPRRERPDPLTPRESEVVKLIAEGLTSREIAERARASASKTVERHRANVLEKLGLKDRVALTRYAIRARPRRALSGRG